MGSPMVLNQGPQEWSHVRFLREVPFFEPGRLIATIHVLQHRPDLARGRYNEAPLHEGCFTHGTSIGRRDASFSFFTSTHI